MNDASRAIFGWLAAKLGIFAPADFREGEPGGEGGILFDAFRLAPEDAIKLFESKGYKLTWSWKDLQKDAHAKAFTVAKVMKADILTDIRNEVEKALRAGTTLAEFQRNLEPILKKKGWWGKVPDFQVPTDPGAPQHIAGKWAQLGSPWRLETIFRTNLQTGYMTGRYRGLKATAATRPFWQYLAVMDKSTRPAHAALHGRIFRADDPIWGKIYPPNGFNCRCRVRSLSESELARYGLKDKVEKTSGGAVLDATGSPIQIDEGWDYNPGEAGLKELQKLESEKRARLAGKLGVRLPPGPGFLPPEDDQVAPIRAKQLGDEIAPSRVQVQTPKPPQTAPTDSGFLPPEDDTVPLAGKRPEEQAVRISKEMLKPVSGATIARAKAAAKHKTESAADLAKALSKLDEIQKPEADVPDFGKLLLPENIDPAKFEETWKLPEGKAPSFGRYGAVVIREDGKILIREPAGHFDGYHWTLAKGGMDKGETSLEAALREVKEELGVTKAETVGMVRHGHGPAKNNFFYIIRAKEVDSSAMDQETQSTKWVTPKEALEHFAQTKNKAGRRRDMGVIIQAIKDWNQYVSGSESPIIFEAWKKAKNVTPAPVVAPPPPAPAPAPAVAAPAPVAPAPVQTAKIKPSAFPIDLGTLKDIKRLGGSTGARLVEDPLTGEKFVQKQGNSPGHLVSEVNADAAYQAGGARVPAMRLYTGGSRPVKLARLVPNAVELGEWLRSASPAEAERMKAEISKHFVLDALLGNYDVAGMGMDNILVDEQGNPWRIDNGGSLSYRAQGAKKTSAQWGKEVLELKTLRDPKINQNTAKIFAGVTDDMIQAQIADIIERKDAIVSAVGPEERDIVAARIEYLRSLLKVQEKKAAASPGRLPGVFPAKFVEKARAQESIGLSLPIDEDQIEDLEVLVWKEKDSTGKLITRARMKMTGAGNAAILDKVLDQVKGEAPKTGQTVPQPDTDEFWPTILAGIKTVNHHQGDGKYNETTLKNMENLIQKLNAKAITKDNEIANYYLAAIQKVLNAKTAKTMVPKIVPYVPPKKAEEQKPAEPEKKAPGGIVAKWGRWKFTSKSRPGKLYTDTGSETATSFSSEIPAIEMETDNGIKMQYSPIRIAGKQIPESRLFAMTGYLEITADGDLDQDTVDRIASAMAKVGIKTEHASPEYREFLYLRQGLHLMQAEDDQVKAIYSDGTLTTGEKVERLKDHIERKLKVRIPSSPNEDYNPDRETTSVGGGHGYLWRWDMPRSKMRKEMKDYLLVHSSSNVVEFVKSVAMAGGEITSTVERTRKGVPIASGMSPGADMGTGGANYFFARLRKASSAKGNYSLVFPIDHLARMDAISFMGDRYGEVKPGYETYRNTTKEEFQSCASNSTNETIFKHGMSLWDVREINTGSVQKRSELIAWFRSQMKMEKWPDGRTLEEVIK
jgi:SPP1 gp7 family putative phage head morphogenesis protein